MPLSDALPTERQRELLNEVVSDALVEIRHLCRLKRCEQAEELAYVMHNIPRAIHGWGRWSWNLTEGLAAEYNARWAGSESPSMFDYSARINSIRGAAA
jgi:hypothetical protein